jgi:hypothetical protein
MNVEDRLKLAKYFLDEVCLPIFKAKGIDYAHEDNDANANFKRIAKSLSRADTLDVWYIFACKHLDTIAAYIKTRKLESSELLIHRIADVINYMLIFYTLLVEEEEKRKSGGTRFITDPPGTVIGEIPLSVSHSGGTFLAGDPNKKEPKL